MWSMRRAPRLTIGVATITTIFLASCSDGDVSTQSAPPSFQSSSSASSTTLNASTKIDSRAEAQRFLARATFGADIETIERLENTNAETWLQSQFSKPSSAYLPKMLTLKASGEASTTRELSHFVWENMISSDDQLRQRMVFALSQIVVVSGANMRNDGPEMAYYLDTLQRNAFGNYRDLLQDITYTPAMADYLTYYRNRKEDPSKNRMPDENYARELLQLFTIGLLELNMDGTPKYLNGEIIETFDNEDIQGLARVFTGFSRKGYSFWNADADGAYKPLVIYADQHSQSEKSFLGNTIPAGTPGPETVDRALDIIFEHPNVAPFISRQLIQRFTHSDPPPDYVERVANAFESGQFVSPSNLTFGTGERGDLKATLAAILLDPSVNTEADAAITHSGKVREPVLKYVNLVRAFNLSPVKVDQEIGLRNTSSPSRALGQHPLQSPSVFNFYRPGFVAAGTESGKAGMTAPEFQIVNSGSITGYLNFTTKFIMDQSPTRQTVESFTPDYSDEILLADSAQSLVEHLDLVLTGETLPDGMRQEIIDVVDSLPITENRSEIDRLNRVHVGIYLIMSSSAYAVQH